MGVEFGQFNATPPVGLRVATVTVDGQQYQAIVLAKPDGTLVDPSANSMLEVPFSTTTVQAVGSTDVSLYRGVAVQIVTQGGSSTVTFQGSNDNTNWVNVALTISTSVTTAPVVSSTSASSYYGPLHFKYFRLNVTGIVSGTTAGVITFSTVYSHSNPITTTAVTLAAAATNVAKAEDSVAASANVGIPPMVVRADTLAADAGVSANGDYAFMFCDNTGRVYTNGLMVGKTGDTTFQTPRIDTATHSLQTIDYAHHEVHAGSSFYYHDVIALGNGATQYYLITTPNTTAWAHFGCEIIYGDAAGITEIFEAGDRVGTTAQTVFNRDRNSLTAATVTVHKDISAGTGDGTKIFYKRVGTGKTDGGAIGTAEERILKQNTKYLLKLTNTSTGTNNTTVILRWYEHTNKTA